MSVVPVVRFSAEEDEALLQRFLFPRPHPRWTTQNVPQCHNVVGNANYCIQFQPTKMLREFANIEYQLKNFPAVIVRIRPPRGATLLSFRSGRTVQMGMSSDVSFNSSVQYWRMELLQKGYMPSLKPLHFANRVYSFDIGFNIAVWNVEFADELGCAFTPLLFPGLVYRLFRPKVTALVFVSGKQMLLGVQHPDHLEPALDHLVPILRKHQYHGTQANSDRKSVLRQAERALQSKLRQQAHMDALPMSKEDQQRWDQAKKMQSKQMKKAVKLVSKRSDIYSLQEMHTAIHAELEQIKQLEARKEANKRKRAASQQSATTHDSDDDDDDDDVGGGNDGGNEDDAYWAPEDRLQMDEAADAPNLDRMLERLID